MSARLDEIFELLPALYRLRDVAEGQNALREHGGTLDDVADYGPLRSLFSVLVREGQIVAEDIAQLYDDHFIETCAPWALSYIGDLIGAREMEDIGRVQSSRQQVASTLALRQRKGTMAALEYSVRAAVGWPVIGVEYWQRLATTESLRRVRVLPGGTANLRDPVAMDRIGTAFDDTPRSAEMGRVETGHGLWNLPNIGLHIYRKEVRPHGTASGISPGIDGFGSLASGGKFRFGSLGADQPLFQRPSPTDLDFDSRPEARDLPMRISRWMLEDDPARYVGQSFDIIAEDGQGFVVASPADIIAADLSTVSGEGATEVWQHGRHATKILVDPELGRFVLPLNGTFSGAGSTFVRWYYGRAHTVGGHERPAEEVPAEADTALRLTATRRINASTMSPASFPGIDGIQLDAAGKTITLTLKPGIDGIVATEGACPEIDCRGWRLRIRTHSQAFLLSGVRFLRTHLLRVEAAPGAGLKVPPVVLAEDCTFSTKQRFTEDGIGIGSNTAIWMADRQTWRMRRCISEGIYTRNDAVFDAEDSIIMARSATVPAIKPQTSNHTGDTISLRRCSVLGRVICTALAGGAPMDRGPLKVALDGQEFAGIEDSVILAEAAGPSQPPIKVARLQQGCVRYSYIPPGSIVPRRFACVPRDTDNPLIMRPHFASLRLPHPGLFQMMPDTPAEILTGAQDGQEMGVGNRLRTAARRNNFARSIDDYVRFGFAAGARYET
ncbi:hypothetical protein [Pacificoceanicola onchidii]|uniref:hypothetical protein n=1 Tax=Pacificoceanicola onchidii TaxID=2562685 RepID=UPI0010A485BE|nr:hypothetical protein [Pacificoceanicola onchidii]